MYILEIIIIVLLIRMIMNQHILDEHIQDTKSIEKNDYICFDGIINNLIFRITVLYKNIKYYLKHKKD